jgi:hypothetical protein
VALETRHKIEVPFTFLLCISMTSCNSLLSARCGCHVTVHPRVGQIPELLFELVIIRLQMVHYTTQRTDVQLGFLLPNVFRFNGAGVNVISFMPSLKGFSRVAYAQQHYYRTSYTEFHSNRTINVGSTDKNLPTPQSEVWNHKCQS